MRRYFVIDAISTIFVEGNVRRIGIPTTERLPDIPELIGYGITLTFQFLAMIAATWPLILNVDPINRDLEGKIPRRLLASLVYGWVTYIAANVCGLYLILILAFCHIFEKRAEKNSQLSKGIVHVNNPNILENMAKVLSKHLLWIIEWIYPKWTTFNRSIITRVNTRSDYRVLRNRLSNFAVKKHDHNTMLLLMDQSNRNMNVFIPTLTGVSIILCIVGNYGYISFYDREDLRIIWFAAICFALYIYFMIMFLCHHAAKPLIFTEETIRYWKRTLIEKLARRQVRAMMTYGFTMGPFFKVKSITAFDIMDNIINHTIKFLLASNS